MAVASVSSDRAPLFSVSCQPATVPPQNRGANTKLSPPLIRRRPA